MKKTVIDRDHWSSFKQIEPSLFMKTVPYWFLTALHMSFRDSKDGYFKNARVCYDNKIVELHRDKHGNIVYRHYEVS